MHIVSWDNLEEFSQASRDVLMMFVDIAEQGGRLTDANIWIRFDPLKFVDAQQDGKGVYGDLDLVKTGSALAILCDFYDRWEEDRPLKDEVTTPFVDAIRNGRLSAFPQIAETVIEALEREAANSLERWFNQAVRPIYRQYVQSYFTRLANVEDWAG